MASRRDRASAAPADAADPALLEAPLLSPSLRWTSRSVADLVGVSQSVVARAWARAYAVETPLPGLPASGLRLVAASSHRGGSLIVLAGPAGPSSVPAPVEVPPMRSPRRPALQVLLATSLRARTRRRLPAAPAYDAELVGAARRRVGPLVPLHVVADHDVDLGPVAGTPAGSSAPRTTQHVVEPSAWQGLLLGLVRRCTASPTAELQAAQQQAMEWARSDRTRFAWAVPAPTERAVAQAWGAGLEDEVLDAVIAALEDGRLVAGARVSEELLARTVRASRGQVRDALRTLASGGLLDHQPYRGAVVPTPQTADVLETYAARRALGALVVRRAAHAPPEALAPAAEALDALLRTAESGGSWATGQADLRFQDALASCTGMLRVPAMFHRLTGQLRLFIAVLGLNYAYSVEGMCADDAALLELVRAGDEAGAVRAWDRKIEDATRYMARQLPLLRP